MYGTAAICLRAFVMGYKGWVNPVPLLYVSIHEREREREREKERNTVILVWHLLLRYQTPVYQNGDAAPMLMSRWRASLVATCRGVFPSLS